MSTRDERADATRGALLRVARELFGQRGYANVGTEEIVERAGVTRGALYHHFNGKRELFAAVHEQLEQEIVTGIAGLMGEVADPVEMLRAGLVAFLDVCTDRPLIQISMVDAPIVLGWAAWRETGERYGLGLITAALAGGMDAGLLRRQQVRPLALVLLGAIDEAALYIANADDPSLARAEMEPVLISLLDGQRTQP